MIQPNEKLLPGNVVMYHGHKDVPQILDALKIYNISYSDSYYPLVYSPIPLTPEILVKWCGFDEFCNQYCKKIGEIDLTIDLNKKIIFIGDKTGDMINAKFPEHLHQLQNLVYFLTGEELVVTIPKQ